MLSLKEFKEPDRHAFSEYLPWSHLCGPGIIEHKDGALQKSYRFRGPDLDSSTKRELMGVAGAFNNALRRLGDGWALFIEAQRNMAGDYPSSICPNEAARRGPIRKRKKSYAKDFLMLAAIGTALELTRKGFWPHHKVGPH